MTDREHTIDKLDRDLIALLKQDARLPLASLAAELDISRATVRSRLERMQRDGVIARFTVELGAAARNSPIRAIVQIEVHGTFTDSVIRKLMAINDIVEVHSTNGRWDLVARLECGDLPGFDEVLRNVRLIEGITKTESHLLLASYYATGRDWPTHGT